MDNMDSSKLLLETLIDNFLNNNLVIMSKFLMFYIPFDLNLLEVC